MHAIRPVIATLKSAILHKLGNGVDLNFQYDARIQIPSIDTNQCKPALDPFIRVNLGRTWKTAGFRVHL